LLSAKSIQNLLSVVTQRKKSDCQEKEEGWGQFYKIDIQQISYDNKRPVDPSRSGFAIMYFI